jgi:hypothetical protein
MSERHLTGMRWAAPADETRHRDRVMRRLPARLRDGSDGITGESRNNLRSMRL